SSTEPGGWGGSAARLLLRDHRTGDRALLDHQRRDRLERVVTFTLDHEAAASHILQGDAPEGELRAALSVRVYLEARALSLHRLGRPAVLDERHSPRLEDRSRRAGGARLSIHPARLAAARVVEVGVAPAGQDAKERDAHADTAFRIIDQRHRADLVLLDALCRHGMELRDGVSAGPCHEPWRSRYRDRGEPGKHDALRCRWTLHDTPPFWLRSKVLA